MDKLELEARSRSQRLEFLPWSSFTTRGCLSEKWRSQKRTPGEWIKLEGYLMGYIPEICGISCNWFEAIISASVGDNKRFLLTEVHLLHVERKNWERKSLGVELILLGVSSTHSPSPVPFEFALGCSTLFRALWLSLSLCHHEKLPLQLVIPDIIKLDYDRGPHYYEICLLDKIWFLSHGTFCSSWKLVIIIVRTKTVPSKDTQSTNTRGKAEADSCPPLTDHTVDFFILSRLA